MSGELNLGLLVKRVANKVPARPAVIQGERALTYADFIDRSTRLARLLHDRGYGARSERSELQGHQSGQHLLAQYLHNCPEYVEGLVGSFLGRVAPFNVNYRYQADELRYLLRDAGPAVIQYHASFAPVLREVLDDLAERPLLLQIADGSGAALLPGAEDYETALASVPAELDVTASPDDLYVIYTGGTTGMPKGVLWRQGDAAISIFGLINRRERREWLSVDECADAVRSTPMNVMPCAPLMHGAAQWAALVALAHGDAVVFPDNTENFAAREALTTVERHGVSLITIVGDAFGWPLVEELERTPYDVSSLRHIVSGGAALHVSCKERLVELIPNVQIIEHIGSSESGPVGTREGTGSAAAPATYQGDATMVVVAEDFSGFLAPGHDDLGWLARRGRIPLGYLGDADKTARTFPTVEGVRISVLGDRARLLDGGQVEMLGRDSLTVNTGGEKVFVEEVEGTLKDHPDVVDALVCGRPSERWGSEVAALVVASATVDPQELIEFCRERIARYKAPKHIRFVDHLVRTATGKPDYRWAQQQLQQSEGASVGTVASSNASSSRKET